MAETKQQVTKHRFNQEDDDKCISEWRRMLGIFKSVAEADKVPANFKETLNSLKNEAKINAHLTGHQTRAILARCDNYLSGRYGNTKRAEHLNHGKS